MKKYKSQPLSGEGSRWKFPVILKSGSLTSSCQQDKVLTYEERRQRGAQKHTDPWCCADKGGDIFPSQCKTCIWLAFCPCPQEGACGSHMEGTSGHSVTAVHQAFFTKSSEMEDLSHVQMNFWFDRLPRAVTFGFCLPLITLQIYPWAAEMEGRWNPVRRKLCIIYAHLHLSLIDKFLPGQSGFFM